MRGWIVAVLLAAAPLGQCAAPGAGDRAVDAGEDASPAAGENGGNRLDAGEDASSAAGKDGGNHLGAGEDASSAAGEDGRNRVDASAGDSGPSVGLDAAGDNAEDHDASFLGPDATGDATTQDAAVVDAAQGHEICSQSWTVVANPYNFPLTGARMLALDGAGNMYVAATFNGTVKVAGQTFQTSGSGAVSVLVVKVDPACRVLWAKAFGAPQASFQIAGVAADAAGNVVVAGAVTGAPVNFGSGPVGPSLGNRAGAVVFKLGPDGAGLWSHVYVAAGSFLVNVQDVGAVDVAIDSRGNTAFVANRWCSPLYSCNSDLGSVDFGGGAVTFTSTLVELDVNGQLLFDANDEVEDDGGYFFTPRSLAAGSAGRIWATGYGDQLDIVAYDASGQQQSVQRISGVGYSYKTDGLLPSVRVDANDEVFTVAPSSHQLADGGFLNDTLLYKFSTSGSTLWTRLVPIPDSTDYVPWTSWSGGRLAVDPAGIALVSSAFAGSADFGAAGTMTSAGGIDSAVVRFDAQGNLIGRARWGGADDDFPADVGVDSAGDAVIAGWSSPPGLDDGGPGPAPSSASFSIFLAKLGW